MISPLLIVSRVWNGRGFLLPALLLIALIGLAARCHYLGSMLALREQLHAASVAREQELGLKLLEATHAVERANGATLTLSGLAEACLEREAQARADGAARAAILANTKPRPRTDAERQEVVDDATRNAAAARLNRSW